MRREIRCLETLLENHYVIILVPVPIRIPQLVLDGLEPPPQKQVSLALGKLALHFLRELIRHAESLQESSCVSPPFFTLPACVARTLLFGSSNE